MKRFAIAAACTLLAGPVFAEAHTGGMEVSGDAEAGDQVFNRQCVACHTVTNDEGEDIAGRGMATGPNLYGVAMRTLGTYEDFDYSESMVQAGEEGMEWTEENFVGYVQDPTGWLREVLDDSRARGKMAFQLRSEEDAQNVYAYLVSIGPEITMEEGEGEEGEDSDS